MPSIGPNCRKITSATAVGLALALLGACGEDSGDAGSANPDSGLTTQEAQEPLAKAPPELVAIREQANEILDEGDGGLEKRLAELEAAGIPAVVNKWASWCGPCREEFPFFQAQAIERGDEVAFIGLLSDDGPETGATFLSELPLPYPSLLDPNLEIADQYGIRREFPATFFVGPDGEVTHTKLGPYVSEDELADEITRYTQ